MRALVTAAEMRAAEEEAASRGLTSAALMQLAGRGAAQALLEPPGGAGARYLVLAGPGNNGGDALVVAGLLRAAGATVQIVTYRRKQASNVDPAGIPRFDIADDTDGSQLRLAVGDSEIVVDGILGTGRARPLEQDLIDALRAVREAPNRPRIVALDLPTGANVDTGAVDPNTLKADQTLTLGYLKRGLLLYPARAYCGDLRLIDIGLPARPAMPVEAFAPEHADVQRWLPVREPTAHKFSAGAVLALAGSPHYVGAPILCSTAAMRAGAGYVTLAASENAISVLATRLLESTMLTLPNSDADGFQQVALQRMQEIASRYRALLIGPGLGRDERAIGLALDVLFNLTGPHGAVVDADALYALSTAPSWWERLKLPLVLTPHTGEMARLCGLTADQIEADRFVAAATWARRWGQVLVLKGAPTVVAAPNGELSLNPTGNQLLATAGTGDVLAGVIAAFLAGGADPFTAARAGVYIHGLAADLATEAFGDRGMLAGDLLPLIPRAIQAVQAIA